MEIGFPSIIFEVENKQFAISCKNVQSIVKLPEVTSMPNYPQHIRGIINLRGQVVQISDLRMMMGFKSIKEDICEFAEMMDKREQDHRNWLNTLEDSVEKNIPFSLTTDPHKCAFGLWYDNYKTDSLILSDILEKFDEPHKAIHAIAVEIEKLKSEGDFETAKAVIERTRDKELSDMIRLFAQVKIIYEKNCQELAIIIENGNRKLGITVDKVISVQEIQEKEIEGSTTDLMNINDQKMIAGIAERSEEDSIIVVLDEKYLLNGESELV